MRVLDIIVISHGNGVGGGDMASKVIYLLYPTRPDLYRDFMRTRVA